MEASMSDIIERAARALCEYHKDSVEWIGDDTEWKWFVPEVQTVLSALREPLLEIVDRHGGCYEQSDYAAGKDAAQSLIYRDIDEALIG
jgi:hypothetical protein